MSETVDAIARLIRAHPAIRAQEAADALGYSEPKALRYWLNKEGYRNFTEFRARVLAGEYVPPVRHAAETPPAWPATPGRLPLATQITAAGEPRFADETGAPPDVQTRPSAFAFRWSGAAYDQYLRPGALLVVDGSAPLGEGDLVLSNDPTEGPALWRQYTLSQGRLLVDPGNPRRTLGPPLSGRWHLLGRIVEVVASP